MSNVLKYKEYCARVEYSTEDQVLFGKIEGIQDLVNFESESIKGIEHAFHEAVDDYLAFCQEVGKNPDKEYSGSFNVRIRPEAHRKLAACAFEEGVTLNHLVDRALTQYTKDIWQNQPNDILYEAFRKGIARPPVTINKGLYGLNWETH